jgi:outer membrane protein OmpA-like peptidoglycan-associated protein
MYRSLIFICFAFFVSVKAQVKTFALKDSSVSTGNNCTLRTIRFDPGKATLLPECYPTLDSIVQFMNRNPAVSLEVQIHSDSRINKNCCDTPSQKRAKSICDYLVQKGIDKSRLFPKGYGDRMLLITDPAINKAKTKEEKEALHSYNRRVVLKIIKAG